MTEDIRAPAKPRFLPEFTDVRLTADYDRNGVKIPRGAIGTIVDVYQGAQSYTIEFADPLKIVETIPITLVTAI